MGWYDTKLEFKRPRRSVNKPYRSLSVRMRIQDCYEICCDDRQLRSGVEDICNGDNFNDFAKEYFNLLDEENFFEN